MKQRTKIILLVVLMLAAAGVFYIDSNGGSLPGRTQSVTTAAYIFPYISVENPVLQRCKLDASRHT